MVKAGGVGWYLLKAAVSAAIASFGKSYGQKICKFAAIQAVIICYILFAGLGAGRLGYKNLANSVRRC